MEAIRLQHVLESRFGVAFVVQQGPASDGRVFRVRPGDLPSTIGFTVEVRLGWRSLELVFVPGPFAADLLRAMEASNPEARSRFRAFATASVQNGAELELRVNASVCDPLADNWPEAWRSCELTLRRRHVPWGEDTISDDERVAAWTCRFVGMPLSLLTFEPVDTSPGDQEGEPIEVVSKRYERSRLNRAVCIEAHGAVCVVCGFDFGEVYGEIGLGFIHVHHIVSLASLGGPVAVDPVRDLAPVCPNCHAMLHTSRPPLLPAALNQILSQRRCGARDRQ